MKNMRKIPLHTAGLLKWSQTQGHVLCFAMFWHQKHFCQILLSQGFLKKKIISGILGCLVWLTLFRRITYSSKLIAQSGHSTEKTHAFRRIQISFNSSMLFSHLCQVSSLSTKFKTKNPLDKLEQYLKGNESHPISSRTCHCHFF